MSSFLLRFDQFLNFRRMAYAWITGGALWLAWLLSIFLGPGNMDLAGQVIGTDYLQFHAAGTTVRQGDSAELYNFDYQARLELEIIGPELVNFHAFITPPFFAFLFVPLSYLPYALSFTVWSVFGLVALYICLRLLTENASIKPFIWSLTFFPVFASISFGQNSLLSLLLFTLTYIFWRKRLPFLAGLLSSLLLYKPQLVLGLGLLWLLEWRRDWKALLGLGIGALALLGISVLFMPAANLAYLDFSRTSLLSMLSWEQFPVWHDHTWRAFWFLLFPNHLSIAEGMGFIFSLIGVAVFLYIWKKQRHNSSLLFACAVILTLWVSPHAMIYDWAILVLPAVIFWQVLDSHRALRKLIFASLWLALMISGPLTVAQLKIFPIALQISMPVFAFIIGMFIMHLSQPAMPAKVIDPIQVTPD
jgi:alpha-1,2-mannosyltransferase